MQPAASSTPSSAVRPARGRLTTGEVIDGKYEVRRELGEGAMGIVYEAENIRIGRRVAIKVLHPHVASDESLVKRFQREAQAAARCGSRHIVDVLDLGELPSGTLYMVMEYLEGKSLQDYLRRPMAPSAIVPIAVQVLDALAEAHAAGIVHRDIKPANIYITKATDGAERMVKVLDFGVSKFRQAGPALDVTSSGAIVGTPSYMSPEQAKADTAVDHRADIYSVGVILYRALSGRAPFRADTFTQLVVKIVVEKPKPLTEVAPDVDPALCDIVHRAMANNPDERFPSARELALALRQWAALQTGEFPLPGDSSRSFPGGLDSSGVGSAPSGAAWFLDSSLSAGGGDIFGLSPSASYPGQPVPAASPDASQASGVLGPLGATMPSATTPLAHDASTAGQSAPAADASGRPRRRSPLPAVGVGLVGAVILATVLSFTMKPDASAGPAAEVSASSEASARAPGPPPAATDRPTAEPEDDRAAPAPTADEEPASDTDAVPDATAEPTTEVRAPTPARGPQDTVGQPTSTPSSTGSSKPRPAIPDIKERVIRTELD